MKIFGKGKGEMGHFVDGEARDEDKIWIADGCAIVNTNSVGDGVANAARSWPVGEARYFIWLDGINGKGFVWSGEFDAQIIGADFLPKSGVLRKEKLESGDARSLNQLKEDYPWPVLDTVKPVKIAVEIPAMFGGLDDSQG
jgi:hypothetical protein